MIPFDFTYYRPDTLKEAVDTYTQLLCEGKTPMYFAGASETITMCRANVIRPSDIIDIKNIPECMQLSIDQQQLHIGSTCTLRQISGSKLFPLLCLTCGRIADHTNQCRITLGGNLCGTIIYRETSLPLLLSDADITLYGPMGERTIPFQSVFNGRMQLNPGELIVKVHIPIWALSASYSHVKKTANEKIDYPLVSLAAIIKDNQLRVAFSGVCSYPFRSNQIEAALNDQTASFSDRVERAAVLLPENAYSDAEGSGEYRTFVFKNALLKLLEDWKYGQI